MAKVKWHPDKRYGFVELSEGPGPLAGPSAGRSAEASLSPLNGWCETCVGGVTGWPIGEGDPFEID